MTTNYKIKKTASFVFETLTDTARFVAAHPVINKMEFIGENRYLVHETIKLGCLSYDFTYHATIESDYESKKIEMVATVMKINTIEMVFYIEELGHHASVTEIITFKTKLPIKRILRRIFKKQHLQLFKMIENSGFSNPGKEVV